jgi:hypothetical protein
MSEIVNMLTRVLTPTPTFQAGEITRTNSRSTSSNPFSSGNPFVRANNEYRRKTIVYRSVRLKNIQTTQKACDFI